MAESKITNIISVIGLIVTLITVVISSCYQQKLAQDSVKIQMNLSVWERKMQSYQMLFQKTSELITNCENKPTFDSLSKNYEQQYWSFLPLLSADARKAMKSFKDDIDVMKEDGGFMSCIEFKQHAYNMLSYLSDTAWNLERIDKWDIK